MRWKRDGASHEAPLPQLTGGSAAQLSQLFCQSQKVFEFKSCPLHTPDPAAGRCTPAAVGPLLGSSSTPAVPPPYPTAPTAPPAKCPSGKQTRHTGWEAWMFRMETRVRLVAATKVTWRVQQRRPSTDRPAYG